MPERRPLVDGLKPSEAAAESEKDFVYGDRRHSKPQEVSNPVAAAAPAPVKILPQMSSRVPLTTRTKPEVASALKRASLQRQLDGTPPFYVQDILEEALESWLRSHGHLD